MARRHLIIGGGALAIVVAGVVLWLLVGRAHGSGPAAAAARPGISAAPAATEGPEVAAALRRLTTDPAALVASGAGGTVGANARQAVPAGSTVVPVASSWAPDGLGGGTMLVTVTGPDGHAVTYVAVMVQEQGAWKVLATFPAASPEPSR